MTCKNCIHYEVCERKDGTSTYTVEDPSLNVVKEINFINCFNFKDRSKFIELPCKVGDTAYIIHRYKDGDGFLQALTVTGIHLRDTIGYRSIPRQEYLVVRGACNLSSHVKLKDIGKTVFFTKEEAEQALRERNNDS